MAIALPFLCLLLIFLGLSNSGKINSKRIAWMLSCLLISILIIIITEVLSAFHAIKALWLIIFWGAICVFMLVFVIKHKSYETKFDFIVFKNKFVNICALLIPVLLLTVTLIIAITAPPNNSDSMTYHMSRVAHWALQGTVAFFPTSTLRELFLPPFAEYSILQTYLLAGSDRFVNLVQWFSYLNTAISVSLIAEQLSASKKGQYLTILFALSLPQAILQSTSTQNDLTNAVFVLFAICFLFLQVRTKSPQWIMPFGISCALGIMTKSTSFIFLIPFLLVLAIYVIKNFTWKTILVCSITALASLALVIPFYLRNFSLFGSFSGPRTETVTYTNNQYDFKILASNSLRNIALNLNYTPKVSGEIQSLISTFLQRMGINESDPASTWQNYKFFVSPFNVNEDTSGSPIHIILIVISLVLMFFFTKKGLGLVHILSVAMVFGFLLFSLILKWQPWNSRLQIPFFFMAAPIFGMVAEKFKITPLIGLLFGFACIPYLLFNTTKPLTQDWNIFDLPRTEMMIRKKDILSPYINGYLYIKNNMNCIAIGLDIENGYWEYPFWNLLVSPNNPKHTLQHINVANESNVLEPRDSQVCAIILVNPANNQQTFVYKGSFFTRVFFESPVSIFSNP